MTDRYRQLETATTTGPALYRCADCDLVLTNLAVHERWHNGQDDECELRERIAAVIASGRMDRSNYELADAVIRELGLRQETVEPWHGKTTHNE